MLGPAGVSHSSDPSRPSQTDPTPTMAAMTAICSGDVEKRRAVAAGMISSAVISSTPTIFIDTAMTAAIRIMKTIFARSGCAPSAVASS